MNMTHSLEDLKSGKLIGLKRLKLACGLKEFPLEILTLAETLEVLDLSDNQMSELPQSVSQLKNLKIVFFAKNSFASFPEVLKDCPALSMIGFKSNKIHTIPENVFPPLLRWLILTDNKIKELPKSIGDCEFLQKCILAGNLIKELPSQMANCHSLELLRVSANKLESIPKWLFELPKLSWVAFGGNPGAYQIDLNVAVESFQWDDFNIEELLGEGASGMISKAHWISKQEDVAIKVFKGDVTSDGLPEDEMAISIVAGKHDSLIQVLGKIKGHPEGKNGLIMELIPSEYSNLGSPPSLDTCTRDVFDQKSVFSEKKLLKIAKSIASVCTQLHSNGISHGDLYAHNILINDSANTLLGDFGAASYYDVNSVLARGIERVEVRAFSCLLEDMLGLVSKDQLCDVQRDKWLKLIDSGMNREVNERLSFSEIEVELNKI